jgi:signal transduction histidine kinase
MNTSEHIQALENKLAITTRLAEASTVLNSTLHLDRLLSYLMDVAADITGSEAASVLLWNARTNQLFFAATTSGGSSSNLIGTSVPVEGSIAGTVLRERRLIQIDDASNDNRIYAKSGQNIDFVTRSMLALPMVSKDKHIGVLEVLNKRASPWTDEDRNYMHILASQAAVAIEAAQLVNALQKANEEMKQLDKLKNDFIAIASHELRTPLGVVMGYASFLQESDNAEVNAHASKVLESALQLRSIIEGMTNLRYLKQKQGELNRERVLLSRLIHEATDEGYALAQTRSQAITFVPPRTDAWVLADVSRIEMALVNLLNNASRFTAERGNITVEGGVASHEGKLEAWVRVTDDGIGIAPENLVRIFDEFVQVEDHMIRKHGGLGIGLSIAKVVTDAHNGRIWAESEGLGRGATVTIALPVVD